MKLDEIKLSHIRNFLKWYHREKENIPFTKKALWRIQKECWSAELEVHWDYRDELSSVQTEKIIEDGLEGYNAVYEDILENNYDYFSSMKDDFIEGLSIDVEDFTEKFICSVMEDCDCQRDEVVEYCEDTYKEFIREQFAEELDVVIDLDDLISRTKGEIYCDFESVAKYDLVSLESIKKSPKDWLYFSVDNLNSREYNEKLNNYHEDTVGFPHQSHLEENAYFSVPVVDSLSEYVELLVKLQDKNEPVFAVNLTLADGTTKTFRTDTMGGDFYWSREGNYVEPDEDKNIVKSYEVVTATEDIKDSNVYSSGTEFMSEVDGIVDEYMVEYMRNHIEAKNFTAKDEEGRTLFHYAIVLGRMDEFVASFDGLWNTYGDRHLIHERDSFGITPFELCKQVSEGEGAAAEFIHRVYGMIISNLPRRYEAAMLWSTPSRLMGNAGGETYYVVESDEEGEQEYNEIDMKSYIGCIEKGSGKYKVLALKDFDWIVPVENVEVRLDGTVAA